MDISVTEKFLSSSAGPQHWDRSVTQSFSPQKVGQFNLAQTKRARETISLTGSHFCPSLSPFHCSEEDNAYCLKYYLSEKVSGPHTMGVDLNGN